MREDAGRVLGGIVAACAALGILVPSGHAAVVGADESSTLRYVTMYTREVVAAPLSVAIRS